jgi:hypothetical protein
MTIASAGLGGERLLATLVEKIRKSGFMETSDDLTTTDGVVQAAIMVIGGMHDELEICFASTRGWSSPLIGSHVDATPAVRAKYKVWLAARRAEVRTDDGGAPPLIAADLALSD